MHKFNTKISVIVPVYKVEQYLPKCINSILSQTFSDFELLLIDDGSPDTSGKICNDYAAKDSRIRVFHKENGGVSSARNLGLREALGEWVCFVDSDDWIEKDCFKVAYKYVIDDQLDCLQFSYKRINSQGNVLITDSAETSVMNLEDYINKGVFCFRAWGSIIRKSIIDSANLRFIEGLKLAEDQIFILTAIAHCKRIKRIQDIFYCYLFNENSATQNSRFLDVCDTIIAFSVFQHKKLFNKYIDERILSHSIFALKLNDCKIPILYKTLKRIDINTKISGLYSINMWFLRLMWKRGLLIALLALKFQYRVRRLL